MEQSTSRAVVLIVCTAIIAGTVGVSVSGAMAQGGAVDPVQAEKPELVAAYERLVAQLQRGTSAPKPGDALLEPFPEDSADIIAGYDRLFTSVRRKVTVLETNAGDVLRKGPNEWTAEERRSVLGFVGANQDLIRDIRRMADRGGPVHPLDFSKGFEMLLPHLSELRGCARVLRADAVLKRSKGNYAEAVDDIIAGMKLADVLTLDPVTISQLVRIAIYGVMYDAAQIAFDGDDLSPDLTRRLMAHLAQADRREAFAGALAGELYMTRKTFSALRSGDRSGIPESMQFGSPSEMDEQTLVDTMSRLVSAARLPYYEAAPDLDELQRDVAGLPTSMAYTRQLVPALTRSSQAQARHEATLDLMQLGILVEQHKARTGSYPKSLDAIASELGGSVPVDPFIGKPYHYQPSDTGFLLYSVGQNLSDDGGKHDWRDGDWVWRGATRR